MDSKKLWQGTAALLAAAMAAGLIVAQPPLPVLADSHTCEDWELICDDYALSCEDYDACYAECMIYYAWGEYGLDCNVCAELDPYCDYWCGGDSDCADQCKEDIQSDMGLTCEEAAPEGPMRVPRDCPTCRIFLQPDDQ